MFLKMKKMILSLGILFLCTVLMGSVNLSTGECSEDIGFRYDLIVVGSDPEGIAAAVSGARNGLEVLLVDTRPAVGGLMTRGWLNTIDMNYAPNRFGPRNEVLNKGIFLEFFKQVEGDSFDVNTAQRVFDKMLDAEDNIDLLLNARAIKPVVNYKRDGNYVEGVEVTGANGRTKTYYAHRIIDATQDADIAAAAGAPFSMGKEDAGFPSRNMAATLVFKLKGISDEDWRTIRRTLNSDGDVNTGANNVSAWGFLEIMEAYEPVNPRVSMRGLNIGRQNDGSILINALHIFNVDALNREEHRKAMQAARSELPYIIEHMSEHIPGFGNIELAATAPELYIRESRHIYGEYRLTIDDVLENRDFPDRIAFGCYPVDVQATARDQKGYVVGNPHQYAIPFRSIVPLKVENLLVVGRSASFDSLAHGSARVIPVGMATGQAAGAAAAISIENDITFRQMAKNQEAITTLQRQLTRQGVDLRPIEHHPRWNAVCDHWSYNGLKFVRKYGLARGNYDNNYRLDETLTANEFVDTLNELAEVYKLKVPEKKDLGIELDQPLTAQDVETIFTKYSHSYNMQNWQHQIRRNIEQNDGEITRGAAHMLLRDYLIRVNGGRII